MMHGKNNAGKRLIKRIVGQVDNGIAIELGVWKGSTTRRLAENFREVHAVDPWHVRAYKNTTEWGGYEHYLSRYTRKYGIPFDEEALQNEYDKVYEEVVEKLKPYENVIIHRMTTKEFFMRYKGVADLIYVDASHSYDDVYSDLVNSWEILNAGGLMVCDDYDTKGWKPEVPEAISDFSAQYNLGYWVEDYHALFKKESLND